MHLESENLQRLKRLAKLDFSTEGSLSPENELNKIISCFEELKKVDTTDVPPLVYPNQTFLKMRDSKPQSSLKKDIIKQMAPDFRDDHFVFPAFLPTQKKEGRE